MRIFLLIMFCGLISCAEKKVDATDSISVSEVIGGPVDKAGKIYSNQPCQLDGNLHFSIYYPARFNTVEKFAVMVLFDPHGDPDFPLEKYKTLADAYDFILIASKDSKNGNGSEQTANIVQSMLYQTTLIEKVDTNRVFTGGFSGGARVASLLALSPSGTKGLMVCGAGIPSGAWTGIPPNVIVAIAGNSDMNLAEILNFKTADPRMLSRFQSIRFSGEHAWPPVSIVENAFIAFTAISQRDRFVPVDTKELERLLSTSKHLADSLKSSIEKVEMYKNILKNFEGMIDVKKEGEKLNALLNSIQYKQALSIENEYHQIEERDRENFLKSLGTKDLTWWKAEFATWEDIRNSKSPQAFNEMKSRVRGVISLSTYMSLNRAVAALHREQSAYFSEIYRLVDPKNSEAWYLSAVSAAMDGNLGQCLTFLDEAIKNGFKDQSRCRMEPAFASFQSDSRFQEKINQIIN